MHRIALLLTAAILAHPARAETTMCQSINGKTTCTHAEGSLSCVTINGDTRCTSSEADTSLRSAQTPRPDIQMDPDGRLHVRTPDGTVIDIPALESRP